MTRYVGGIEPALEEMVVLLGEAVKERKRLALAHDGRRFESGVVDLEVGSGSGEGEGNGMQGDGTEMCLR